MKQLTTRAAPDLLAAISERQSMAIVKQPRRTFAGERQSAGEDTCAHRIINSARNPFVAASTSDSRGPDLLFSRLPIPDAFGRGFSRGQVYLNSVVAHRASVGGFWQGGIV